MPLVLLRQARPRDRCLRRVRRAEGRGALRLVDVRSDEAWAQGRIRGAVHLHLPARSPSAPRELDPALPVVVYCWSPVVGATPARRRARVREAGLLRQGDDRRLRVLGARGSAHRERRGRTPRAVRPQVMVVRTTRSRQLTVQAPRATGPSPTPAASAARRTQPGERAVAVRRGSTTSHTHDRHVVATAGFQRR